MNNPADSNRHIQAAGAVTVIAGILTAALPAAWMVVLGITRGMVDAPPQTELGLVLLLGAVLVLLGWGVLRHIRLCAAVAGALALVPLVLQTLAAVTGGAERMSVFFLMLSLFVLGANWLAWREIAGPRPERVEQVKVEQ